MTGSTPKGRLPYKHVQARAESRGNGLKPGSRFARGERSAVLAALFSILLASCSSTSEPSLELTTPAFTDAGSPNVTVTDAADQAVTGEGDVALPEEVAATPAAKPDDKNSAAAEAEKTEGQPAAVAEAAAAVPEAKPDARGQGVCAVAPADGPVLENGGPILTAGVMPERRSSPRRRASCRPSSARRRQRPIRAAPEREAARDAKAKPIITLPDAGAEKKKQRLPSASLRSAPGMTASTTVLEISRCRACARPICSRSSASPASTTTATSTSTRTRADHTTWPPPPVSRASRPTAS